jgi:hypothetical protein
MRKHSYRVGINETEPFHFTMDDLENRRVSTFPTFPEFRLAAGALVASIIETEPFRIVVKRH